MVDKSWATSQPPIYFVRTTGGCLSPIFPEGSLHTVSAHHKPIVGDLVAVWFRPNFGRDEVCLVKILQGDHASTITLLMLKPLTLLTVARSDVLAMHKIFATREPNGESHWVSAILRSRMLEFLQCEGSA